VRGEFSIGAGNQITIDTARENKETNIGGKRTMGGPESGRWRSGGSWRHAARRLTVDESLTLDARRMQHEGLLMSGQSGTLEWPLQEDIVATIAFNVDRECLALDYIVTLPDVTNHIQTEIRLVSTRPYFGGQCFWFTCPLDQTGRKYTKLYLPPGTLHFGCRICHHLAYPSHQYEKPDKLFQSPGKWVPKRAPEQYLDFFRRISAGPLSHTLVTDGSRPT
jgi:hypothetical protein